MTDMGQRILELNQGERDWIRDNLLGIQKLVQSVIGDDSPDWLQPAHLDAGYRFWHASHKRGAEDPNPLINAFGISFGQFLVNELKLEWKVLKDQHGTELAIHGTPGDILLFPPNLVAKRYEKEETDFFLPLSREIIGQVQQVRRLHGR